MKLTQAIEEYVQRKRALGGIFTTDARALRSFARSIGGNLRLDEITPAQCWHFCYGSGPTTRTSAGKHQLLKRFFRQAVGRGYLAKSPAEGPTRRAATTFLPYIYSVAEVQSLLDAASAISRNSPFDGTTLRALILVLYATGLRVGEALRLRCCDVDLKKWILTVWNSKFFKSRLVPFGSGLARSLVAYAEHRQRFPFPLQERSAYFATPSGERISLGRVEFRFRRLCEGAGIRGEDSSRHKPRLHDLRATFAVHRLVAWYHEGVEAQERLPFLATYLGHTSVAGTQVYLRMTPELLREASQLFEAYAAPSKEVRHG